MVVSSRSARFPKRLRLKTRGEFLRTQQGGRKIHLSHFLVFALRVDGASTVDTRLGITVTKKVGHAVFRNRIKRWVRESFRVERERFPPGWDLVFVAKRQCVNADYEAVLRDVKSAGRKLSRRCQSNPPTPSTPPRPCHQ